MAREFLDSVLGALTWNAETREWNGQADLTPKHPVALCIDLLGDHGEIDAAFQEGMVAARAAWQRLRADERATRLLVAAVFVEDASHLFTFIGRGWDAERVAAHLVLREVTLDGHGARLTYDGRNDLAGMAFTAYVSDELGVEWADMD